VTGDEECPPTGPNPYCDKVGPDYRGSCHDRKDYSDVTGLYTCNDGTHKTDWRGCKDATENRDDNSDDNSKTTSTPLPYSTVVPGPVQNSAVNESRWYSGCGGGGKQDGGFLQFNTMTYEDCGNNADGDKAYYDGFVEGCMGIDDTNTKELCQAFIVGCLRAQSVDSSESCDVAVDTSSAEWKLVMTQPSYEEG
jgi:hypothetical protein